MSNISGLQPDAAGRVSINVSISEANLANAAAKLRQIAAEIQGDSPDSGQNQAADSDILLYNLANTDGVCQISAYRADSGAISAGIMLINQSAKFATLQIERIAQWLELGRLVNESCQSIQIKLDILEQGWT